MLIRALNDIWIALRRFDDQALTIASRAVLIYIIIITVKNIVNRLRGKKCDKWWQILRSVCLFGLLCIYLSYLMSLTLSGREAGSRSNKVNLEIFGTWSPGGSISPHALENVLLFIPFGILVPLLSRFFMKWWNLVLGAFIVSLGIETTQIVTARGYFEIDDILLNSLGAIMGYAVFWIIHHSYIAVKHETQIPLSKHEQQINRITLFAIQLLPVVLVVMMIFGFGNDTADKSTELSMFVTEKLLYVLNKLLNMKWTAEKIHNAVPVYEGAVRKGAHITEYAMLTFFSFVFLYCRKIKNSMAFILSFVFSAFIAVLDEYNQYHVDGRSGSLTDVVIDCIGAFAVLLIILILLSMVRLYNGYGRLKEKIRVFK